MEEEGRVSLHTPQPFRLMWQGRHQLGGLHHRHHVGGGEGRVSLHPPPLLVHPDGVSWASEAGCEDEDSDHAWSEECAHPVSHGWQVIHVNVGLAALGAS